MGARWEELRAVCQRPVRSGNDVAGLLFGDHASLLVTKLFVDLGLSPNYASVGFLISGLVGAALQVGAGAWALSGALALVMYYVLDCVDGEVARWQKVVNVEWGYYDYLFHMLIKPLAFFGIGLGTYFQSGSTWLLCAAFAAAIATLWRKILIEIPGILFLKDVLRRARASESAAPAAAEPAPSPAAEGKPFQLEFDLITLRAALTNFDVGLVLLALACAIDLFAPARTFELAGPLTARAAWIAYYGVVLPLDFLDYLVTYLRKQHFSSEMTRLLSLAHHFRVESVDRRER